MSEQDDSNISACSADTKISDDSDVFNVDKSYVLTFKVPFVCFKAPCACPIGNGRLQCLPNDGRDHMPRRGVSPSRPNTFFC